jgi:Zn finger protein HypA/HybF involved in hydrogenase expression
VVPYKSPADHYRHVTMSQGLWRRLKTLTGTETEGVEAGTSEPSSSLFECRGCGSVYISEEMQACPNCGNAVARVPNERELGFGRAHR